ncbi:MAG: hypothetical protein ACP5QG_06690, partial [candidate division WOR-3 bacterium]
MKYLIYLFLGTVICFSPSFLMAQTEEGGGVAPAEGGGEEFGSGASLEEEVTGQPSFAIDDAKKPILDVTLKPFEPVDSLISIRERSLEKRLPSSVEKQLVEVIKLHNKFLRQPVYPQEVVKEINLEIQKPRKKVDLWTLE